MCDDDDEFDEKRIGGAFRHWQDFWQVQTYSEVDTWLVVAKYVGLNECDELSWTQISQAQMNGPWQ